MSPEATLEWLNDGGGTPLLEDHKRNIRALLAEPRLPAEPLSNYLVEKIWWAAGYGETHRQTAERIMGVLRDDLTKPKTVEMWRVEYAVYVGSPFYWQPRVDLADNKEAAEIRAEEIRKINDQTHVRVTGPYQHEVPA